MPKISAVAFVPEVKFEKKFKIAISLNSGISLLPASHMHAIRLRQSIEKKGHKIKDGIFLYFNGYLREDGTIYEVFQSYCLALTFYYEGRATCRAYQQIYNQVYQDVEIFIDEYDKFNYDARDAKILKKKDREKIIIFYKRISSQLASKEFNPLNNSIEFFNLFLKEVSTKIRLLYLMICLESMFLEESDAEGISYKLGTRCAYILTHDDKAIDKMKVYYEIKSGYELRSKIIHGGNYQKASKKIIKGEKSEAKSELDHIQILERIVKRVYKIIFYSDDYYNSVIKDGLGRMIDNNLVFMS
jgi:hypothetical protein